MLCKNCGRERGTVPRSFGRLCRECRRIYINAWARERRKRDPLTNKKTRDHLKTRNRAILREYLLAHPCVDCGEADPVVLEFDHRSEKRLAVGTICGMGWSVTALMAEIAKCDVRCANCHRRKTARAQGWAERKAAR